MDRPPRGQLPSNENEGLSGRKVASRSHHGPHRGDRVVLLREKPVRASRSTLRQPRFPSVIRVSRGEREEHAFFAFSRPNGTATKQHRLPFQPSSPSTTIERIMFFSREAIHPLLASQISLR